MDVYERGIIDDIHPTSKIQLTQLRLCCPGALWRFVAVPIRPHRSS